tara:strand:+ start:105 stop:644 length:540 start_codon:yes stop_codon:yes gene_type:complete
MSELRTNRIVPQDGLPSGSAGGIIQVRQKVITGTYSESVPPGNSGPYGNIVDSETITPSRSDSKILIMMNLNVGASNDGNLSVTLHRNGSVISGAVGASPGSRTPVTATEYTGSTSRQVQMNVTYLDSPASTSAQTYGFKFSTAENGNMTCYLNRDNNFGSSYHTQKPISTITLMELTG